MTSPLLQLQPAPPLVQCATVFLWDPSGPSKWLWPSLRPWLHLPQVPGISASLHSPLSQSCPGRWFYNSPVPPLACVPQLPHEVLPVLALVSYPTQSCPAPFNLGSTLLGSSKPPSSPLHFGILVWWAENPDSQHPKSRCLSLLAKPQTIQ